MFWLGLTSNSMCPIFSIRFATGVVAILAAAAFQGSLWGAGDWEEEALLLYNSGSPEINDLRARSTGNERLKLYARALGQLHVQPMREENALLAKETFETLFESNPNDQVGIASVYYLARINHKYLDQPDLEAVRSDYRYIFESYPSRFFGELAFLKYLLIELYNEESTQSVSNRIASLEMLGDQLTIPDMIRGYHRAVGDAYLGYELSKKKAYEHLKVAYEIRSAVPETQVELMLSVAELAEFYGEKDVAIAALQDFLNVANGDDRTGEVALRIEALNPK